RTGQALTRQTSRESSHAVAGSLISHDDSRPTALTGCPDLPPPVFRRMPKGTAAKQKRGKAMTHTTTLDTTTGLESEPELMTTEEVAALFNVTPSTVLGWVSDGGLTSIRIGTSLHRFPTAQLRQFVDNSRSTSSASVG